jgi:hypothetical protein
LGKIAKGKGWQQVTNAAADATTERDHARAHANADNNIAATEKNVKKTEAD